MTNYYANTLSVINTATNLISATVPVGSIPTGICVTPDGNYIYVANYGDNTVSVISSATNAVTTTIPVGTKPYGVTISPDGSKVYVSNRTDHSVSVISTASNTVIALVKICTNCGLSVSPTEAKYMRRIMAVIQLVL